jgi:hypothetical protein
MEERSWGERNWHGCNIKFGHCATTPKEHFRGTRIANRWNSCKPSVRRSFFSPRRHQSGARKTKLSSILGLFNRTTAFAGSNRRLYILRLILPNFLGHRRNLRIVVSESGEVSWRSGYCGASHRSANLFFFFEGDCLSFQMGSETWILVASMFSNLRGSMAEVQRYKNLFRVSRAFVVAKLNDNRCDSQ